MPDIELHIADGIASIVLNRPHRKNAFTLAMITEWASMLEAIRTDGEVRVVVLRGNGGAFCSGIDLAELEGTEIGAFEWKSILTEKIHRIAFAMEDLDKPVIASVSGAAIGAGMDMALMCDMRIAGRSARFSEGYVRVGLVPGDGGCFWLPRLVGPAKALELLLTGDFVDADEAQRLGIVNAVVEDDALDAATTSFAKRLADGPPIAIRMIKRAVYQSMRTDMRTALDLISSHMGIVTQTADSREAFQAFREKRAPEFKGS
jgi:enoyl-CoA hydratase/carnithine racemase